MASFQEYKNLCSTNPKSSKAPTTEARGHNNYWTPPPKAALKLNVDAHPCDDGRWGLGLVLRTEEGKCVGAA
ncbi:hypothetical protein A2U01_0106688, partial [Trifolium medium]|nr:hypothetical protein [Trifolium medium]